MITETCSCSATITLPDKGPSYSKEWETVMAALKDWRENHRHESGISDTPGPSGNSDIPYIDETHSSHERAPQHLSTENDIPFGFTRNA